MTSDVVRHHADSEVDAAAQALSDFVTKPYIKAPRAERLRVIAEEAQALSLLTGTPLRTIVNTLAQTSFLRFQLLPDEFERYFREHRLAYVIVQNFSHNVQTRFSGMPLNDSGDSEYQAMRALLFAHADAYSPASEKTLDRMIVEQSALHPHVNFAQIVADASFQVLLSERIEQASIAIVSPAYHDLFEQDAEKFILEFLFYRVFHIDVDTGVVQVKDAPLHSLMRFLHQEGYPLEYIYLILYRRHALMKSVRDTNEDVRQKIHSTIPALLQSDPLLEESAELSFLHSRFDFDAFWKREFEPVISDVRKPSGRGAPRMIDFLAQPLSTSVRPEQAYDPFKELVGGFRVSDEFFERFVRLEFSYPPSMPFDVVQRELAAHLETAAKQFDYTRHHAFSRRAPDDPIHQDCQYVPEILQCRTIRDLISWIADPERFFETYPQHSDIVAPDVIRFEALRFYQLFLFCREHLFASSIQDISRQRDLLETHLREALSISETISRPVSYRVGMKLDPATGAPFFDADGLPQYDVFFEHEDHFGVAPDQEKVCGTDKGLWRLFPFESASLTMASVTIPRTHGRSVQGIVQFYTGDGRLIHGKHPESIISSMLRGKVPTDYVRFSVVAELPNVEQALKDYFYHIASTGANKIDDADEKRSIQQMTQSKVRGAGSRVYRSERPYDAAHHILIPVMGEDGRVSYVQVLFEVQILHFRTMLAAVSDYTVTSHGKVYVPEREFRNWFSVFMPPVVFGSQYADHQLAGFDGKKM